MEQVFSQIKYIRESFSLNYLIKRLEVAKQNYLKHFTSWSSIYLASGSASLLNIEIMSFLSCFVSSDKKTWLLTASDWNNKKLRENQKRKPRIYIRNVKKLPKAEHYLALRISLFNLFKGKRKNATTNIYLFLFYLFFHLGIFQDCLKKRFSIIKTYNKKLQNNLKT